MPRPIFIVSALVSVFLGWLVIGRITHSYRTKLLAQVSPTSLDLAAYGQLIEHQTDVNQLLRLGLSLTAKYEYDAALIVLNRADTLSPESRDVQVILADSLLRKAQIASKEDQPTLLAKARQAIQHAKHLDPNNPSVHELSQTLDQLGGPTGAQG